MEKEDSKCLAGGVGSRQWCAVFYGVVRDGLTDRNKLASEQRTEVHEEAHHVDNSQAHDLSAGTASTKALREGLHMVYFIYKSYQLQMEVELSP